MVKVVDVEITLDNFKRAFNRAPTQPELGAMMRLKARRQEKQPSMKKVMWKMEKSLYSQKVAQDAARNRELRTDIVVTKQVWSINYLLGLGLEKNQIIEALHISDQMYSNSLIRYNLPRQGLIKRFKHETPANTI
tara:strand:+ start:169 stop:573 length:405 start_codon:yes stop_codon:yes gene_type:complete